MRTVSVVIPVYNAEKTLRKCVESILFGTYRDVEVILVEDCSRDGSWALCQALAQQYANVLAIQNEKNSGVSHTRNRGLDAATGQYILFCDSDDWVAAEFVQMLVEQAESNADAMVCCGYVKCFATEQKIVSLGSDKYDMVEREELFCLMDQELIHYVWNKCFRSNVIRAAVLQFDENQYMGEDLQFVLDYMNAAQCWRCQVINVPLYFYSQMNPQSLVSRWSRTENLEQAVSRIRQLAQIVENTDLGEQKVRELKESFVYLIARDKTRTRQQRVQDIETVMGDGNSSDHYRRQRWLCFKEQVADLLETCKKGIPLWIKCPLTVLLSEFGRWPLDVVFAHMRRSFAQNGGCGEAGKRRAEQAIQKTTYAWVRKHYRSLLEERAKAYTLGQPVENGTVWVFWWQGEDKAPAIVQRCIASIRKNAGAHPVQVIDQWNYAQFVSIPAHIEEKRERGVISLTHFSDYLRMALLAAHGGLWLDATIYVTGDLQQAFRDPIFTVRNPGRDEGNISGWNWSVFGISGNRQYILFCLVRDLLDAYWHGSDHLIDYYIFDYMIRLVYDSCEQVRTAINNIPENNPGLYFYQENFNLEAQGKNPPADTWLYKLSWKGRYTANTDDGAETVYGRWLRETEDMACQK